jgi:hypothetical protein
MDSPKDKEKVDESVFSATVVRIVNDSRLVINRGLTHGIKQGQKLLVYSLGEEVIDPNNGEFLGQLELVKGTGKVIHIQEKMSTIESDKKQVQRRIIKRSNLFGLPGEEIVEEPLNDLVPFEEPEIGDRVKPI